MTARTDEVPARWVKRVLGKDLKELRAGNVFEDGDTIYSYGYHFPMAQALRDRTGEVRLWLINGDRVSVSTSRHQSAVRAAINTYRGSTPQVIIPFTALDAAGILHNSVRAIDVSADRTLVDEIVHYEQPEGSVWHDDVIIDQFERNGYLDRDGNPWEGPPEPTVMDVPKWHAYCEQVEREKLEKGVHWGSVQSTVTRIERRLYTDKRLIVPWDVEELPDGRTRYSRTRYTHLLGASLVTADVQYFSRRTGSRRTRKAYFLSGFDSNESRPSYFFCELPPKARPATLEEAYEALKPDPVRLAEQMGRTVRRQGDIFAVELRGMTKRALTKQGAVYRKHGTLFGTNHVGTEVAYLPDGTTLARGTLRHAPADRAPDHKRLTVGRNWSLIVKNTVPISA